MEIMHLRLMLSGVLVLGLLLAFAALPAIPQPQWYHDFADQRPLLGLPHAGNVLSNLPFLIVGLWGLWQCRGQSIRLSSPVEYRLWRLFFVFFMLVGLGSGYYHLAPSDHSLLWDRLPIAMAFATLLAIGAGERLAPRLALPALLVLPGYAIASVFYWWLMEMAGNGDLRPYLLLQAATLALLLLWYGLFPGRYTGEGKMLLAVSLYLLAVLSEWLDRPIYQFTGWLSGHTLKHLLIALAMALLLWMLRSRRPRAVNSH